LKQKAFCEMLFQHFANQLKKTKMMSLTAKAWSAKPDAVISGTPKAK
jgi:hypothetical protein